MLNTKGLNATTFLSKSFITDQDWRYCSKKTNTSTVGFEPTLGMGVSASTSTIVLINAGGFDDQYITAYLQFVPPTAIGAEEIGVMCRVQSVDSPSVHYYYARASLGIAKLTKVVSGSFTNLSTTTFSLSQSQLVSITLQTVGNQISASFIPIGGSPTAVWLTATDSSIQTGGGFAVRSQNSSFFCPSFIVREL